MTTQTYRLTVIGCVVSWFLIGLHWPAVHQMTHHGRTPSWGVLVALTLMSLTAMAGLWLLLRAPTRERQQPS